MSDELDEFLRQAAERRKQRQQQKSARPQISPPPSAANAPPPVLAEPVRSPLSTLSRSSSDDVYDRANAPKSQSLPSRENSARSDARPSTAPTSSRDNSTFGKLTSQFDQNPSASQSMDSQKRNKKSKSSVRGSDQGSLGQLTNQPDVHATPPADGSAQWSNLSIAQQLRNPQSVRSAIILSEVLKRPWE